MPQNKNNMIRYQVLDRCFSDFRHRYYIDDLIDACADELYDKTGVEMVSRRTIFNDISFMESDAGWSIPLERLRDGKKTYYRYADKDFSINKKDLTEEEINQIKTTILTLSRYRGLPSNEWLDDVISNLEYRFGLKSHKENVISFEQNKLLKGIEHLSPLIDAASNRQTVRMKYHSFGREAETCVVYPYFLKQHNSRWFLLGKKKEMGLISIMALDRIEELELTDLEFEENYEIDFERYFDDVIGVTMPLVGTEKERIRIEFDEKRFPYILSKPIHLSQKVTDEENREIEIEVKPTKELDTLLLSFGAQAKVISPEWYKEHIKHKIEENLKKYY